MHRPRPNRAWLVCPDLLSLEARWNPVRFDFRFDDDAPAAGGVGFFGTVGMVQALQDAGKEIGGQLLDALSAITPDLTLNRTWAAQYVNPATGAVVRRVNLAVPQDVIVVYVAGRAGLVSDGGVAFAAPGTVAGTTGGGLFEDTVTTRGQTGARGLDGHFIDFGPWGGSVAFDTNTNWYFGADPAGAAPGQVDFRTTALHELGHVLGYGASDAWFANVTQYASDGNFYFTGQAATAEYGDAAVPVDVADGAGAHWAGGVRSPQDGNAPALMNADPAGRARRGYTRLDLAGLRDIGWQVNLPAIAKGNGGPAGNPLPPPATPLDYGSGASLAPVSSGELTVIAPGPGRVGTVQAYGPNGVLRTEFAPYGEFTGGVRVASAEVNADGYADVVTAPGPGLGPLLRVYDGADGSLRRSWLAYEESFTGGVFVAAGDFNGDGYTDIVTSPDVGGGPRVRVFDGKSGLVTADFFGIDDPAFRGGARIAVGDINGDGVPDLVVAAGAGGGPRVAIFDGATIGRGGEPEKLAPDFFIFEPVLRDGVFVSVGDFNGDGRGDLVVGAGPGGAPRVFVASGLDLARPSGATLTTVANFFAGDTANRGGVRVAVKDTPGDGAPELVVAPGTDAGSVVTRYAGANLADAAPTPISSRALYEASFNGGVFVG
jgi:hypothetical protein